jgi:polygalacturonase
MFPRLLISRLSLHAVFLCLLANTLLFTASVSAAPSVSSPPAETSDEWAGMKEILSRIVPPQFPQRDFLVTDYGASAGGRNDCHPAFVRAIDACVKAGGGRVVVPRGWYLLNGPIHLASNVNLHVSEGATVTFAAEVEYFLPVVLTRWEGTMLYAHSPRIYVRGATNVAITGKGVIDGNGRATLAVMKNSKARGSSGELRKMGAEGVPVEQRIFGEGKWMRPSLIQPIECTNVLIEDVTIRDSTFWIVHPVLCRNVTVRGITVESWNGNNDGVDPDSCTDVLIENCTLRTGDDSIAIKSGRDQDAWRVGRPSENIVIRNNIMGSRHAGVCIGSEMSGGVRNVYVEDCRMESVSSALYFKGNLDRGGLVENVRARRIHVQKVRSGLVWFETTYPGYRGGNFPPSFRNYIMEDLTCDEATGYAINVEGAEKAPIRDVVIRRATVHKARHPLSVKLVENFRLEDVRVNGQLLPTNPPMSPAAASEKH